MIQKIVFFFVVLFCIQKSNAQTFKIDTLQYKGSGANAINLVILGDGYTKDELIYFQEDAKRFTDYFFKVEPFSHYINYFNVLAINTISEESGATHACTAVDCPKVHHNHEDLPARFNKFPTRIAVPEAAPNTIFGSSFDNGGIHRLVIPQKSDKIEAVLKEHIPNYTQVVVLVNSPFYGGSGGKYATATVNSESNDIAVHEIGHSFSNLGDEYWAGNQYATEEANRTQEADPKKVVWNHWLGTNGVGVYAYGGKDSKAKWFRPHEFCKMQYLVAPFCNVCQEVIVENIHNKSNPILTAFPNSEILKADEINKFSVKLLKPSPNTMRVRWYLNEELLTANVDSIYLNKGILKQGTNILKVEVKDTTDLVRNPRHVHNMYTKEWQINAEKLYDLALPVSTWGDTLETCFDGYQALSVKQPQAGLTYRWYETEKSKRPIAVGDNWITPKLKTDRTYYVTSTYGKKISAPKAVYVKVLSEISRPNNIKIEEVEGKYKVSLDEEVVNKYRIVWYNNPEEPIRSRQSQGILEIPVVDAPSKIYFELIDKVTTCKSSKFEIKLK